MRAQLIKARVNWRVTLKFPFSEIENTKYKSARSVWDRVRVHIDSTPDINHSQHLATTLMSSDDNYSGEEGDYYDEMMECTDDGQPLFNR